MIWSSMFIEKYMLITLADKVSEDYGGNCKIKITQLNSCM